MSTTAAMPQLAERDARALTQTMTVCEHHPDASDTEVAVLSSHWCDDHWETETYFVSPATGHCTCDDAFYNDPDGHCKHWRRVMFKRGERAIPQWANRAAIDRDIRPDQ